MKFNLLIQGNGYQLSTEASSIGEFTEIRDFLRKEGLIGAPGTQTATGSGTQAPEKNAGKAEEVKKEADKPKTEAKPKAEAKKEPAKAADTAKTAAGPTIEEVTAVLSAVADKFGVPEALALNKRFGVKKAGELDAAQYADYIKFAHHCLDDEAKPTDAHPDFDGAKDDDVSSLV